MFKNIFRNSAMQYNVRKKVADLKAADRWTVDDDK